jgi:3-oxoacyl-[acyl-carrier protein] reductase
VRAFVAESIERLDGLDIVVHNTSASAQRGPEQWVNSFNIDLMPFVNLVDAAQPSLVSSGAGAVVAIGTTNAIETAPPASANSYGAMKAAVIQYASALGHTLAPVGIRVNTVSPGPVWFAGGVWEQLKDTRRGLYDSVVASIPLGSMATDEDVANAVAFLASPAAGHITGANLVVDGGLTKRVQL